MLYYVIAADGSRYGPADIDTLNGWIQEGRISPTMLLEEESSGARIAASAVPGLVFQQPPQPAAAPSTGGTPTPPSSGDSNPGASGSPYNQSYQRPTSQYSAPDTGGTETVLSWILLAVGVVGCCCFGVGCIPSGIGIWLANKGRQKGSSSAMASMVLNIIFCSLSVMTLIYCLVAWPQVKQQWQQAMQQQQQQRQPGFSPPTSNP